MAGNSSLASVAESHFENSKLKLDHLRAFVWLRTTNDIAADDSSKPKMNRGSYREILGSRIESWEQQSCRPQITTTSCPRNSSFVLRTFRR